MASKPEFRTISATLPIILPLHFPHDCVQLLGLASGSQACGTLSVTPLSALLSGQVGMKANQHMFL